MKAILVHFLGLVFFVATTWYVAGGWGGGVGVRFCIVLWFCVLQVVASAICDDWGFYKKRKAAAPGPNSADKEQIDYLENNYK